MTAQDIEQILIRIKNLYDAFVDAKNTCSTATDPHKKLENEQEVDTRHKLLFDLVTKHPIEGSPPFTEVEHFSTWKEHVELLINTLRGKEKEEQTRIGTDERGKQRFKREKKQKLRSDLVFFLQQCREYEKSKLYKKRERCEALKNCVERIQEYITDTVVADVDFDTICNKSAEIIRNALSRVEISLAPENHWANLKKSLDTNNPIIFALQEKAEQCQHI